MPTREFYQERFQTQLKQLNSEQRAAVFQIEGPVMVVAGPGTGKTQLLTTRIGQILTETDTQASSILCLTFSDAGVTAMRNRLLSLIGPEAHRIGIYTFHSFCNRIIQENLSLFGNRHLDALTELERIQIIHSILDKLPPSHPLIVGKGNRYFFQPHLAHLFRTIKTENWSVDHVRRETVTYTNALPDRPEFQYKRAYKERKQGDPKTGSIEAEERRMAQLLAGVDLFPNYEKALHQAARYDYEDMLLWVIRLFRAENWLLRSYQERFQYILVDEYQDTNGAQNELLLQLASYWDTNPNLLVVGDDDQSIYEFQGARLRNMLDLYQKFQQFIQLIVLHQNYRSGPQILEAASGLIQLNDQRLFNALGLSSQEKHLTSANKTVGSGHISIVEYSNRQQEVAALAHQIVDLISSGVEPASIGVIYARHKQGERLIALLEKKGIPYHTKREANVLEEPLIQHLIRLMRYLQLELQSPYQGESELFLLLHAAFWQLDPNDLANLSAYRAGKPANGKPHWRQMLRDSSLLKRRKLINPARLLEIGDLLSSWISDAANLSVPHLLERVINQSGLLAFLLQAKDKNWWLAALSTLVRFTTTEAGRQSNYDLNHWLSTLKQMQGNRLPLPIKPIVNQTNGVQLMTAHGSKGLEFEHVFLMDANQKAWEPGNRGSRTFSFPDTLTFSGASNEIEARRRLFFVAITRAKSSLQLSWGKEDEQGKALQPAQFIDELLEEKKIVLQQATVPPDILTDSELELLRQHAEQVHVPAPPERILKELIKGFRFSPSSLNRFLDCPVAFYFESLLKVPVQASNSALMGIAVHQALERIFAKKDRKESDLVSFFRQEMKRLQGQMDPTEWDNRVARGAHFLPLYFRAKSHSWPAFSLLEFRVQEVEVDGVPLTGVVDRVDLVGGNQAVVIDYKTGRYQKGRAQSPNEKQPIGGPYWRQLQFYHLLLKGHPVLKGRQLSHGIISFVEPDYQNRFYEHEVYFNTEDQELIREVIRKSWDRIQQFDFLEGCGKASCKWCSFTRYNLQVASFVNEEIEGLDDRS